MDTKSIRDLPLEAVNLPTLRPETAKALAALARLSSQLQGFAERFAENHDLRAFIALLRHLDQAASDPEINKSEIVSKIVRQINDALGDLDLSAAYDQDELAKVFALPARRAVNSENAKGRSEAHQRGFNSAKELCRRWFADPALYKNKAAFKRDVVAKDWCADPATVDRWLGEFLKDTDVRPSESWLTKFGAKYM